MRCGGEPSRRFQTIVGWTASSQSGQDVLQPLAATRDAIADAAVDMLGINRRRVQVRSGEENPVDYARLLREGQISPAVFHEFRYQTIDDHDDPHHARPGGFQFAQLDR